MVRSGRKPRVLDLFCGAGGLSKGFERAGFEIVAGLDNDKASIKSFSLNHPSALAFHRDIREVDSREFEDLGDIDVVIGGPSCQGFSTHGKRIMEDPRNFLFREFMRVVRDVDPAWVLIENVKGLLWYDKGAFRMRIHEALEELGYRVDSKLLLAANYGVPQLRERIFFIATKTDLPLTFPRKTHGPDRELPWVTVQDAIGDLPSLGLGGGRSAVPYTSPPLTEYQRVMREGSDLLTLQEARPVSEDALSIISRIPQGNGVRYLPEDELPERFRRMRTISNGKLRKDCTTLYYRLPGDKPAYTITCYFRNVSAGPFVHPLDNRALSYREAARLQSFPDAHVIERPNIPKQIGNAVPPLLAEAIAKTILSAINGELNDTSEQDADRELALF